MLVTGGTGFLGKHVVKALRLRGVEVRLNKGDLTKSGTNNEYFPGGTDFVAESPTTVHLAAVCGGIGANVAAPKKFMLDNLQIGINTVQAANLAAHIYGGCRFVNVGTTCSYPENCGDSAKESELWDGLPEPTNRPYGLAKRMICEAVEVCNKADERFHGTNLILANLYGPGDHYERERSHVIPGMIQAFDDGLQGGPVRLWGTGEPRREFLFVEDAAEAIAVAACADKPFRGTYNVGSGEIVSMRELANMLKAIMGYDGPIIWDTSKPDGQTTRGLDSSKWRRESLWSPKTSLWEGLQLTVQDYRARYCEAVHAS